MIIEIWADFVCPWCYIAESRFAAALARFTHAAEVRVHRRCFELDPATPRLSRQTPVQMLSEKYRVSPEQAAGMEARVAALAAAEGLTMDPGRYVANTRDAHRLVHHAEPLGLRDALTARLYRAHFAERLALDDPAVLGKLAAEVGMPEPTALETLRSDAHEADVARDVEAARELGASGVPFYVFDGAFAVSGAQTAVVFLTALERAWREREGAARP